MHHNVPENAQGKTQETTGSRHRGRIRRSRGCRAQAGREIDTRKTTQSDEGLHILHSETSESQV